MLFCECNVGGYHFLQNKMIDDLIRFYTMNRIISDFSLFMTKNQKTLVIPQSDFPGFHSFVLFCFFFENQISQIFLPLSNFSTGNRLSGHQ